LADLKEKIEKLSAPMLDSIGAFIVDIQNAYENRQLVIRLFIDTDSGITIGQCADISRRLGKELESLNAIEGSYVLQVSSPDLKKSLKLLRQYKKNIGRNFHIRYKIGEETKEKKAKLSGLNGNSLIFDTDGKEEFAVNFNEIIESKVELPW
jgi:ribosome maturation factor RimP